jgi:hypothetical protein
MSTIREQISKIRSMNKLLSSDALITDRVIAKELTDTANFLIKRETDKRKLWSTSNLFTFIPCVPLETVPISECCEFPSNRLIAKSTIKLPKVAEGNYGYLIQGVFSTEITRKLTEVTPQRYINILKLNLPTNEIYYWLQNGHLYLSDSDVEIVSFSAFFEEPVPNSLLFPTEDCGCAPRKNNLEDKCKNPLDLEFKCPGYLHKAVSDITIEALLKTYFRVPDDKTSNNSDDQVNKV